MDNDDFKRFIESQIEEILKHKWIESEKAGTDLGSKAVHDWINRYGTTFREYWESKNRNNGIDMAKGRRLTVMCFLKRFIRFPKSLI